MLLPAGVRAERVLEIFLYGGLGPFESFYVVEDYGKPTDPRFPSEQWYLFDAIKNAVFSRCNMPDAGLFPFATDALGKQVKLGPAVSPLSQRADLVSRLRVMVHRHDIEPHEGAIPYAISGSRLGSGRLAGPGAAISHYFAEREPRTVPYSYVLYGGNEKSLNNVRVASSVGLHPGSARPLDLSVVKGQDLLEQLQRSKLGSARDAQDALVALYAQNHRARYQSQGAALRSQSLEDYQFATQMLKNAPQLAPLFEADLLNSLSGQTCGESANPASTLMALKTAVHLLTHPTTPARYTMVVDNGLIESSGGGGYDTHTNHLVDTSRNLLSLLTALASLIREPGDDNPDLLDLDTTLVVLNTEFGRTPYVQSGSGDGTNHHPYGYVTCWLGGPIGPEQAGIVGAIGPDGWSDHYVTPVEARAGLLAALGIWPFSPESYAIGDLRSGGLERDGVVWLNEILMGRT